MLGSEVTTSEGRLAIVSILTAVFSSIAELNPFIQGIIIICAAALVWKYMDTREKVKTVKAL